MEQTQEGIHIAHLYELESPKLSLIFHKAYISLTTCRASLLEDQNSKPLVLYHEPIL